MKKSSTSATATKSAFYVPELPENPIPVKFLTADNSAIQAAAVYKIHADRSDKASAFIKNNSDSTDPDVIEKVKQARKFVSEQSAFLLEHKEDGAFLSTLTGADRTMFYEVLRSYRVKVSFTADELTAINKVRELILNQAKGKKEKGGFKDAYIRELKAALSFIRIPTSAAIFKPMDIPVNSSELNRSTSRLVWLSSHALTLKEGSKTDYVPVTIDGFHEIFAKWLHECADKFADGTLTTVTLLTEQAKRNAKKADKASA